jgi:cytochrome c oxidase cbb3-type subunit 3
MSTAPGDPHSKIVHRYDDIEEEDNQMPNWWLFILFGTIVFMFGYWLVFHTTHALLDPRAEYEAEVAKIKKARLAEAPLSDEAILAVAADSKLLEEGKQVFAATCAACHAQEGQGLVGPNLTDRFWLHGNKPSEIARSVTDGFADKGMPPWGQLLGQDKVRKVSAFVVSIKGKDLTGKAPQGDARD